MAFAIHKWVDKYLFGLKILLAWPIVKALQRKTKTPKKIAFIKLWALGDSVNSLPLIRAVKHKHPEAKITVITRKSNAQVFRSQPFIDEIVLFEPDRFFSIVKHFRTYDWAFDLEPYLNVSALLAAYVGKETTGFSHNVRSILYTHRILFNKKQHIVKTYLDMAKPFDVSAKPKALIPLRYPKTTENTIKQLMKKEGLKGRVIGMMPGVGPNIREREWSKEKYKELCADILKKRNITIALIGGKEDWTTNEHIKNGNAHIINLSGKTGPPGSEELFCFIAQLKMLVSNDTGPMHIAAAQGVPTIGLFGPNTPVIWGPYGPKNVSIFHPKKGCPFLNNTSHELAPSRLTHDQKTCMDAISVAEVLKEVKKRL